jgi:hypothetical protein
MNLKYAKEISLIKSCPPKACKPGARDVFRVVHANLSHPNNFLPPAQINPRRVFPNDEKKCSAYALSLFVSKDAVVNFVKAVEKLNPNIRKSLGDHVASGFVQPSDGLLSAPDAYGHFDLFESATANVAPNFKIVGAIP